MYGRVKSKPVAPFKPNFVQNDKIILTFDGFFRQKILEPNSEQYDLIRKVKMMYFMEDDTVTVVEPPYINSGYHQGRIIRRSRIIKDPIRNLHLSWKDLNIGIEIKIFGITFHLTDCDAFTKEFLISNGIELNDMHIPTPEPRSIKQRPVTAPVNRTLWFKSSEIRPNIGIVLGFESIRIDEKKQLCDCVPYHISYYLEDGTISVKERKHRDESFDFCPYLIKRVRVPRYSKRLINSLIVAEEDSFSEEKDERDYIQPSDFNVGKEVNLLGHRFLIRDCDARTRRYYEDILKVQQGEKIQFDQIRSIKLRNDTPKYIGFGTPEDSLASCKSLIPREPRKNIIQYIVNANKYLRFGCVIDSARPDDQNRQFILKYSLADGKISIHELSITNSGIQGGKYLSPQLIPKNDCYT
ncbi:EF-hand domain-containing protein 1-like, partial [Contarinia nasturtii]|uniref:EF-hand domain-containing protein 1-like n=1 Tax=Contarinia nasturtii TaxID=265458 RepID=UPI0012D40E7E